MLLQQFVEESEKGERLSRRSCKLTIHSAKGQEWQVVFVIGLVEFWFPAALCDPAERLLMKRSGGCSTLLSRVPKGICFFHYKQSVNQYGKVFSRISRFVKELPYRIRNHNTISGLAGEQQN